MITNSHDDSDIQKILKGFPVDAIHSAGDTIYAMRPDLTIIYVNQGWTLFATQNGGSMSASLASPVGTNLLDAIPSVLRPFFVQNFSTCLGENRPWEHHYECSSGSVYRRFAMMTYPSCNAERLLVVNSIEQVSPHTREAHEPLEALYRDEHGLVIQCCHCRRIQRCGTPRIWDWVPDWVDNYPVNTSHGLCEPCFGFYYSKDALAKGVAPKIFKTFE